MARQGILVGESTRVQSRPYKAMNVHYGPLILGIILVCILGLSEVSASSSLSYYDEGSQEDPLAGRNEYAANMVNRDPAFVYNMLSKLRKSILKPLVNNKRGLDFGLGRGFSGTQAAKHFMGMAAAKYAGGPGKRKRNNQYDDLDDHRPHF
eukprot:TRINITY_DN20099_c0_g1_i1.p1 TRINITY_DN20099_c0_g1~~TRINITY_DN20099_c0_g1_i1.p1  ORF type:complete len:151 (+),score=29.74 TRINITY_DN20099_c0_g1_i1:44-496(+)